MPHLSALLTPIPDWQIDASCASHEPELWWADEANENARAYAMDICSTCPVRGDCLRHALALPERDGIWGGLLPHQRKSLRRAEQRRRAA